MGFDCELVLLIPLKKLDVFCDRVRNFEKFYAKSSYFDERFTGLTVDGAEEFIQEVQDRISKCLQGQKLQQYPSKRLEVQYSREGRRGGIDVSCHFPSLDYWDRRFGCFPILVSGDCAERCITSLLQERNRSMFYAFLEIFPITLGFYDIDGSYVLSDGNIEHLEINFGNSLEFDRTLFLGPEMLRFFEEYHLDEIDFFFKKKIGPQRYLFAGWLLYSVHNRNYFLEGNFSDGEICIKDRLAFHDEKQLRILEGERLRLLGFPKEIPDYKDWDSTKSSSN
jgi:hypothetical protein